VRLPEWGIVKAFRACRRGDTPLACQVEDGGSKDLASLKKSVQPTNEPLCSIGASHARMPIADVSA